MGTRRPGKNSEDGGGSFPSTSTNSDASGGFSYVYPDKESQLKLVRSYLGSVTDIVRNNFVEIGKSDFLQLKWPQNLRLLEETGNTFTLSGKCRRATRKRVAIKFVCKRDTVRAEEKDIFLKHIRKGHDNVVKLFGWIPEGEKSSETGVYHCLFFEYCDAGTLITLINRFNLERTFVPPDCVWHVYGELIGALQFLHLDASKNGAIIHADINPINVLMSWTSRDAVARNHYPRVKMGGFGLSTFLELKGQDLEGKVMIRSLGSTKWAPPGWLSHLWQGTKYDVWGVGATIHALCHHGLPPLQ